MRWVCGFVVLVDDVAAQQRGFGLMNFFPQLAKKNRLPPQSNKMCSFPGPWLVFLSASACLGLKGGLNLDNDQLLPWVVRCVSDHRQGTQSGRVFVASFDSATLERVRHALNATQVFQHPQEGDAN